ncbi:hypothetical protein HYS47_02185 [Candidatus Woesearchaeota archaeon]|nr:hypothetical protein [Candidatus Woesearchaeota archaeon]
MPPWVSSKQGQATVFIVLGVIILIVGFLAFSFFTAKPGDSSLVQEPPEANVVKTYIDHCLEDQLRQLIPLIALQGGYYIAPNHGLKYDLPGLPVQIRIPYYLLDGEKEIPGISTIEQELSLGMEELFSECANMSVFPFRVRAMMEMAIINITLTETSVQADAFFPLQIIGEGAAKDISAFKGVIESPLYTYYDIASEMTQVQRENGYLVCLTCLTKVSEEKDIDWRITQIQENNSVSIIHTLSNQSNPVIFQFAHQFKTPEIEEAEEFANDSGEDEESNEE